MKPFDVICIGSVTVDHILKTQQSFSKTKSGDKILLTNKYLYTGGAATNSAVALTKLKLNVGVISKVGNDHDGDFVVNELTTHKIQFLTKKRSALPTSSSYIIVSNTDHDRIIYTYKGASNDLTTKDFSLRTLNPQWIYLGTLLEKSFITAKAIAHHAKKHHIPLLFNPSIYLAKQGIAHSKDILKATTLLVLNKEEAQLLLKTKNPNPEFLLTKLHEHGPQSIIITDGPNTITALYNHTFFKITPPQVKVINTTGAGDAFAATMVGMLIHKQPFGNALNAAVINSTSVVGAHGPKEGLVDYKTLCKEIKK